MDPFAGSGAVSRLGRFLGYKTASNDIESYAALIAKSRITLSPVMMEAAFYGEGGSRAVFAALNSFASGAKASEAAAFLSSGKERETWLQAFYAAEKTAPYMGLHYAPSCTAEADWRSERLFYTAENAAFLDRARDAIEYRYPGDVLDASCSNPDAKAVLLDALLYQAATHTNTSGVFKACHRGFGGHGRDALKRIMAPLKLEVPVLLPNNPGEYACMDAAEFCASRSADIIYLDPPYNQHQYGSNYHILTSLALWDKPEIPSGTDAEGNLLNRSGIRSDWIRTRSDYCRRPMAAQALRTLLCNTDSRFILLSYNDGGIIPYEQLIEILGETGAVSLQVLPYTAYRGGRQGASRIERTRELLFILDRRAAASSTLREKKKLHAELKRRAFITRIDSLLEGRFHPERVRQQFTDDELLVDACGRLVGASLFHGVDLYSLNMDKLQKITGKLEACACSDYTEALELVLHGLESDESGTDSSRSLHGAEAVKLLKKIAFKKYAEQYEHFYVRLLCLMRKHPAVYDRALTALERLHLIALQRGVQKIHEP